MEEIHLSKRLQMNASMVTLNSRVVDIGCDHAYVSIWLCQNGIADKVIAMDVNEGPVQRAIENIKAYGYSDRIDVRLSDGVEKLEPGQADTLLIGGMGGRLMEKILTDYPKTTKSVKELVLQPQSEPEIVRKCIRQLGFSIVCEKMLIEDRKYYNAIHAVNKNDDNSYTHEQLEVYDTFGKYLLENQDETLKECLVGRLNQFEQGMNFASGEGVKTLKEKIELVRKGLEYYGM